MTSTNKEPKTVKSTPPKRPRPTVPNHTATEKAQAVLAVWTERCKPAEVCRQLNINWITFKQWQSRAMEGMLQALENRVNLSKGEALIPRLQSLLQQRQRTVHPQKLASRLEQIQLASQENPAPKTE
jgi:transposase-like protein